MYKLKELLDRLLVSTSVLSEVVFAKEQNLLVFDPNNIFTLDTVLDFNKGSFDKVVVTKDNNGEVKLLNIRNTYASKGVFISDIIHTASFSKLIASWNSDTPIGTAISVEAQVLVNGEWSDWISWGSWSTNKERFSVNEDINTKLAGICTDTLYVKDDKKATAFRLKTILSSTKLKGTPILRSVSATIDLGSGAKRVYPSNENIEAIENVDKNLNVPAFSQLVRDPQIAGSICNPTSATCTINYYLEKKNQSSVLPEESAYAIYDSVYGGFGNWSFGAAYIGSFGLNCRVEFGASLYDLKREIYNERPVIISVKYAKNENNVDPNVAKFPLIHGFPMLVTRGHLITVTGFTKIDGKEYVFVNDSAATSNAEAKLIYLAHELDAAWATSGRVMYTTNDLTVATYNPLQRMPSDLYKTKNANNDGLVDCLELQLDCKGNIIDLSNDNVKIIMVSKDGGSYEYIIPDLNANLWFANNAPSGEYSFIFIAKDDKEYTAKILWPNGKLDKE